LILHGTKTSAVLHSVLTELYHLKRDNAVKFSKKNDNIRPFESGGEASLEFFSLKTDCSLFVVRCLSVSLVNFSNIFFYVQLCSSISS
jgi:ribosome production factor 2